MDQHGDPDVGAYFMADIRAKDERLLFTHTRISMDIELELFGALRDLEAGDRLRLPVAGGTVADLREALMGHAAERWPRITPGLLKSCAFATPDTVLRDSALLPADGHMVVLPPVSGG